MVSKNTIEEAMLRCAQAKLKLEREVTGAKDGQWLLLYFHTFKKIKYF